MLSPTSLYVTIIGAFPCGDVVIPPSEDEEVMDDWDDKETTGEKEGASGLRTAVAPAAKTTEDEDK